MKKHLTVLILSTVLYNVIVAQNSLDRITRNDTIAVVQGGVELSMPWAGGLNNGQFSEIDVNNDGLMDLFIFQANNRFDYFTGDRITILLRDTSNTSASGFKYVLSRDYDNAFPNLEYFAQLRDFNNDGKMDLFTRNDRDRISIYRNDANPDLQFTEFISDVTTNHPPGLPPSFPIFPDLFQDFVNMSSFEDIDGDGDLDILILDRGEQFIEYHKNISPTLDTMVFQIFNTCWGNIHLTVDTMLMNTCPPFNVPNPERKKPKHTVDQGGGKGNKDAGISILALDLNGDGVKDLISGSNNSLRMAMNTGGSTAANPSNMGSTTFDYPPVNPANDINEFAIPSFVDVDHDGVKDLLVSPIWDQFLDFESIFFYKNAGTNNFPDFQLQTRGFLQEDMIDVGRGAFPVFVDYNSDSLLDIVIGNEGYFKSRGIGPTSDQLTSRLALFENIGTPREPRFELKDRNFGLLDTIILNTTTNQPANGLSPTFGDVDGDGDEDMIVGDLFGNVHYFENDPVGGVIRFKAPEKNYQNINVGAHSAPQLFDLNGDSLLDLIIGNKAGLLSYYENQGTEKSPNFAHITDSLGNVFTRDEFWEFFGHSRPFFYRQDSTENVQLVCGTYSGFLYFYDSIATNGNIHDTFRLRDITFQNIWEGPLSSITGADINADSSMDFLVGNFAGGVGLFTGDPRAQYFPGIEERNEKLDIAIYPVPASDFIRFEINGRNADRNQYQARVYSLFGTEVIRQQTVRAKDRIDIQSLSPGIYFLELQLDNLSRPSTQKFIKL